ncbi:MAG: tetratricopeptide repeat protein [Sandaracinaceae bacterium]|nr:tetratricopeptide repeat protein [Sandaracinaceae bacterium]
MDGLRMRMVAALAPWVIGALVLASALPAGAQPAQRDQVAALNIRAMNEYGNFEFDRAQELLEEALALCQRHRITDTPLARTYMNLAIVAIGARQDTGAGLDLFVQALNADANIELDPALSSPDIQSRFILAQQRHSRGGGATAGAAAGGQGLALEHEPIAEQLVNTPVPVYLEVPGGTEISEVMLYFRTGGMRRYERVAMTAMAGGYGAEIPCRRVVAPSVRYYIVVFGPGGSSVGFAGSANEPFEVVVVGERSLAAPSLPGQAAAAQCVGQPQCAEDECDESAPQGEGAACTESPECASGLECLEGLCSWDRSTAPQEPGPRFFFHFGAGAGMFYATSGMVADGLPPQDNNPAIPPGDWNSPDWAAYIDPSTGLSGCNPGPERDIGGVIYATQDECHVRVTSNGFVPSHQLDIEVGGYFTDRVGLAVGVRVNIKAGLGTLSRVMFNLRGQLQLTRPTFTGINVALHAGIGIGQIQLQPTQRPNPATPDVRMREPWIQTGLLSVSAGLTTSYRVFNGFGFYLEPELVVLVPMGAGNKMSWGLDLAGGVEISF